MGRTNPLGVAGLQVACFCLVWGLFAPSLQAQREQSFPRPEYFLSFAPYHNGDFNDASKGFRSAARSGLRSVEGRWIDSICYHTMLGECLYQMGEPAAAMEQYTSALQLMLTHRNWLLAVEFQPIQGQMQGVRTAVPWGPRARTSLFGNFQDRYLVAQGELVPTLRQGNNVIRPAQYYDFYVNEIARCVAISLKRRAEILGPTAVHDRMTSDLVQCFSSPIGPANHWSQAWVDCWLGLAYVGANRPVEAMAALQGSLVVAGQYDHPLTGIALVEMGKIAFRQGQYDAAARYFFEATFPAVAFEQHDILEEAFRWGSLTHIVSGQQGVYPPLAPALAWAQRKSLAHVGASLMVELTEQLLRGDVAAASDMLDQARRAMLRRHMSLGNVGGRLQYLAAMLNFQVGNIDAGNDALALALKYQQKSSYWLYQLTIADALATKGTVTDRVADEMYASLLREPLPADWAIHPQDTLAVWMTPSTPAFEHWFELALRRNEDAKALQISDALRRRQFLSALPLGGRMLALRWVMEAPEEMLTETARLQRLDLLGKYPAYADLSAQVAQLRKELSTLSIVPEDPVELEKQNSLLAELGKASEHQELMLLRIAVGREPVEFAFPRLRDVSQIRQQIGEEQVILTYFATRGTLYGFALTKDALTVWKMSGAAKVKGAVANLLKQMGHFDSNFALGPKEITNTAWKQTAEQLFRTLTNQKPTAKCIVPWEKCTELIIVPHGPLWYMPFEAVPISKDDSTEPLIANVRVRYAPLLSLTVPDTRPISPTLETLVIAGKVHVKDGDETPESAITEFSNVLPGVKRYQPSRVPANLFSSICPRLVVYSSLEDQARRGPLGWSPFTGDGPRGSIGAWMDLPWGGPLQVILPGFATPAESALKKAGAGDEMFLTTCGLMATGSRSILISRWRVGGRSTYRLMAEYLQELPHMAPDSAWQRAVQLVRSEELDLEKEPRINRSSFKESIQADHPFFWAGYMLVDPGQMPGPSDAPPPIEKMEAKPEDAAAVDNDKDMDALNDAQENLELEVSKIGEEGLGNGAEPMDDEKPMDDKKPAKRKPAKKVKAK